MKLASVAVALNEERFIGPHIAHIPDRVDKVVLRSMRPWHGKVAELDSTDVIAEHAGAEVITDEWKTEADQRNYGQEVLQSYDWIITLDPDEFIVDWEEFFNFLATAPYNVDAFVCEKQFTYWKDGYVADPPEDHRQVIAIRPNVRYVENRVIDRPFGIAPIKVHHFSWARTDDEVLQKLRHYSEQHFDSDKWFKEVWKEWHEGVQDVHPSTPKSLHNLIKAELPPELEKLNLWP